MEFKEIKNYKKGIENANVKKAISELENILKDIEIYDFDVWESGNGLNDQNYFITATSEKEAIDKLVEIYGDVENKKQILKDIKDGVIQVSILRIN